MTLRNTASVIDLILLEIQEVWRMGQFYVRILWCIYACIENYAHDLTILGDLCYLGRFMPKF